MPVFRQSSSLQHPVADVFAWHERSGAFQRLTPPWEDVRVARAEGGIRDGAIVELVMKKGPIDLTWEIEHRDYVQNQQFVDVQRRGPFERWVHTHRFSGDDAGGTLMEDEIEWEPPMGMAGEFFAGPMVQRDLARGFAFRHRRLAHDLDLHAAFADRPRLKVAITGAGGLIGRALSALLTSGGHEVVPMVRSRSRAVDGAVFWDPMAGHVDVQGLAGVNAVVHLAGEPINGVRWTRAKKDAIRASRVKGTRTLAEAIAGLHDVKSLIMASAV